MLQNVAKYLFPLLFVSVLWSSNAYSLPANPALPDAYLAKSPQVKLTLLEFSAPWCVTCQMLKPSVKKLTQETGKDLNLIELNIDDDKNKAMVKRYSIIATPTFIVFNAKGQVIKRLESEVSGDELKKEILKDLGKKP